MWVATTRLALALAGGGIGQAKRGISEGFIVVETNYRVRVLPYHFTCVSLSACFATDRLWEDSPCAQAEPHTHGFMHHSSCNLQPQLLTVTCRYTPTPHHSCRRLSCGSSRAASASCPTCLWACSLARAWLQRSPAACLRMPLWHICASTHIRM